jgi:zinc/manganese transport system permease protein
VVLGVALDVRGQPRHRPALIASGVAALAGTAATWLGILLAYDSYYWPPGGPAAAARSFTRRPGHAIAVASGIALVTVWAGIALSYRTNWPLGFYAGVIAAGFFLLGQVLTTVRRHASASRPRLSADQ